MAAATQVLLDAGFESAELSSGRQRYVRTGTSLRATVGPHTVSLYRQSGVGLAGVKGLATIDIANLAGLESVLATLRGNRP